MIAASDIHKTFGTVTAVDGISFEVKTGEIFGLLGPNGAGKSTTINMLVGLLTPDSGTVRIDGGDPTQSAYRMKIGAAPQALAIYEDLTAEENLRFFGSLYGLHGRKLTERVNWCLDLAALTERRKDYAKTYSGGMKRRLNLVCALVHDPVLLLLDEPTVGVDPQSRNMIFDKIELLKKDGRTIVYTTHYMEEAQRLCDRVAIVDQGRMLDLDTVPKLIEKHGGSALVVAELQQQPPEGVSLPGELDELTLRFQSDKPLEDTARLNAQGIKMQSIRIDRADLESVFLNLTGRRLRDK